MKRCAILAALFFGLSLRLAFGQAANNPVIDAPTNNGSVTITSGNAFQTILSAVTLVGGLPGPRHSLTIQNNNTNGDNCWLFVGTAVASAGRSILLAQGASYTRYFPYVPSDALQGTCATTSDTLYVDTQ
jgi:hypothetical protein